MSLSDIAISVRGLGKAYTIRHAATRAPTTLAEAMLERIRHPLGRTQEREEFWALRDVSFDVKRGEVVGVSGRNGAGKSTLLKVLSRITEPTTGEVDLYGRVGSLLEVGTGFHQELTGRENIFLNGAILGMTRAEIRREFDAIVDFSGVEKFLDTPVKRYSSGMYVRLAFAVAAHLRSEILIVDEVLAVGDAEFQGKCLGKMKEVAGLGRTVFLVSHRLDFVIDLCSKGFLVRDVHLAFLGPARESVIRYTETATLVPADAPSVDSYRRRRRSVGVVDIVAVDIDGSGVPTSVQVLIHIDVHCATAEIVCLLSVISTTGVTAFSVSSMDYGPPLSMSRGRHTIRIGIPTESLLPDSYVMDVRIAPNTSALAWDGFWSDMGTPIRARARSDGRPTTRRC